MVAPFLALRVFIPRAGLLGCSIAPEPEQARVVVAEPLQNPVFVYSYTIEPNRETPKPALFGHICRLSTRSCMDLDSRPFEPCLATTKTCPQTGAKAMRVEEPALFEPLAFESR